MDCSTPRRLRSQGSSASPWSCCSTPSRAIIDQDSRERFRDEPERTVVLRLLAWADRLAALGPGRAPGEAPGVATILAARAAPPVSDAVMQSWFDRRIPLGPLGADDAAALLAAHDPGLPAEMRRRIVAALGGMPLHLVVAARRLAALGADRREAEVAALERAGLASVAADTALEALQPRFLDRLRVSGLPQGLTARDVRALAYPGMLLRQMTEEYLVEVIAPAVGIDLSDPRSPTPRSTRSASRTGWSSPSRAAACCANGPECAARCSRWCSRAMPTPAPG